MGGQQDKAQIQLTLHQETIIAGDRISGAANLIVSKNLNDLIVVFKLTGKEVNSFTQSDARHEGKVQILNHRLILYNSHGHNVRAGNYSLPFLISTPSQIPGTFVSKSRKYQAKVVYFVKVEMLDQQNNLIGKHKLPLIIKQAINAERYSMINHNTNSIKCCDCISKGESSVKAHLNKNAYLPGETVNLWVEVDNSRSRAALNSISIKLFQIIRVISNKNVAKVIKKSIYSSKHAMNLGAGERLLSENALNVEIPLEFKKTDLSICGSTDGRIVQCKFEIEVITNYGMMENGGGSLDMQLMIYPTEHPAPPQASAPEEWNPTEMPLVDFDVQNYQNY